jgi:beta-lysine 5,6-aminomutase alpha subunit
MGHTDKLGLDRGKIANCRALAERVVGDLLPEIKARTTDSIERTILRLWGVEGCVKESDVPIVNATIDALKRTGRITDGIAAPIASLVNSTGLDVTQVCTGLLSGTLLWPCREECVRDDVRERAETLTTDGFARVREMLQDREARRTGKETPPPWLYVIVATGNIHEDVKQAVAAVSAGADCIAVIRSTAQSLLDYVPEGPTTEGYGGTYATGANFAIMREALNEAGEKAGRYVRLVNYASGLCMPEISILAAQHGLDILLNDCIYGIIFRDIHRMRTLVDQFLSRKICTAAKIIINTGEDNYLTTADAVEAAHTVLASQFINERFALEAGMPSELMGLGHAFEVDPSIENSLLYELATAQLVREVFPDAPIKYMPPTRHKSGDIFYSHVLDSMFNLASVATGQHIHLCGMLTEAIHTPFVHDRFLSLDSARMIRNSARGLENEIRFQPDGFIVNRAKKVLGEAEELLEQIASIGLLPALADGVFAEIKRPPEGGRGGDGVFVKSDEYLDPFEKGVSSDE